MRYFILIVLACLSFQTYAQKEVKDIKYFYYQLNKDKSFISYLNAKKEFESKKTDFVLPSSKEAVLEMENNRTQILKNEKTYAAFLNRYGMKSSGDYAKLWFKPLEELKVFLKKNPEFQQLTPEERQSIMDKWYFSEVKQ